MITKTASRISSRFDNYDFSGDFVWIIKEFDKISIITDGFNYYEFGDLYMVILQSMIRIAQKRGVKINLLQSNFNNHDKIKYENHKN